MQLLHPSYWLVALGSFGIGGIEFCPPISDDDGGGCLAIIDSGTSFLGELHFTSWRVIGVVVIGVGLAGKLPHPLFFSIARLSPVLVLPDVRIAGIPERRLAPIVQAITSQYDCVPDYEDGGFFVCDCSEGLGNFPDITIQFIAVRLESAEICGLTPLMGSLFVALFNVGLNSRGSDGPCCPPFGLLVGVAD